jgi:hypothetical protein
MHSSPFFSYSAAKDQIMSLLDGLLGNIGNLQGLAEKLGLPADKVQGLTESVQARIAAGGDQLTALKEAAAEHGVSMESLQSLLSNPGETLSGLKDSVMGVLDKDGDGNPLNDLGGMVKGLFGKS